ncbi:spore germination protein [Bacillus sp. SL00103]
MVRHKHLRFKRTFFNLEVEEPQSEVLVRGPRIGFIENLEKNTALIRERANDQILSFKR